MSSILLSPAEMCKAAATVTMVLNSMKVEFGIMGGAGVSLISSQYDEVQPRVTADIDLIVRPDPSNNITADKVSQRLLKEHSDLFEGVNQHGVTIPALRFNRGSTTILVEVEMFDVEAWPQRPQYNLDNPENPRTAISVAGEKVPVMSAAWILREKLSSQLGREGSKKEISDIDDIETLTGLLGDKELKIEGPELTKALQRLLTKRPGMQPELERVVDCKEVFPS